MASDNPWLQLQRDPDEGIYLLDGDRDYIRRHNEKYASRSDRKIAVKSIPEPYIGSPNSASLVLLGLNPGHSEENEEEHRDSALKEALFRNLRHEEQKYPFYPLNPAFAKTEVGKWWLAHTRMLWEEVGVEVLSKKLLVIEWFPYHSIKSGLGQRPVCGESQRYSHALALQMLRKEGIVILGMRARSHWIGVSPEFVKVPFLHSPQNTRITRGNMDTGLFDRILETLKLDT